MKTTSLITILPDKPYRFFLLIFFLCLMHYLATPVAAKQDEGQASIAAALNQQIKVINKCVRSTWKNQRSYSRYNEDLNKNVHKEGENILQGAVPYFAITKYLKLPVSDYEKAKIAAKEIPTEYREKVILLFDSLWQLQEQQVIIGRQFSELTNFNPRKTDTTTVNQAYKYLAELDKINTDYRNLSLQFEALALQIHKRYCSSGQNSWVKGATAMKIVIDTARNYLEMARIGKFSKQNQLDTLQLGLMLTELQKNRSINTQNIKETGSYDGNSAPNRYDKFIEKIRKMMGEYYGYIPLETYSPKPYEYIVNEFNWAVESYNNFARVSAMENMGEAPAFLLQSVIELGLYKFQYPLLKQQNEKAEQKISMEGFAYNHTVLLLDVSGSMNQPEKLPLLKEAISQLSEVMRKEDRLSVVIYSDNARVILENVSFTDKQSLYTLSKLTSSGRTNAQKGIKLAYQLAEKEFIEQGNNRVILASDGDFTVFEETIKDVNEATEKGIHLSVFSFGWQVENETQLKHLAEAGQGNYIHVTKKNSFEALLSELQAISK
ncbi:vWA domain-containing protein [Chondrinema litorale]|uniref:vWA domain-containing protein n=1 Tax=Chondrinema litorale TaxID=2994555 RepID=UPI002543F934|nr:VWA domain-containing protein [Chondrinema litorale]UZR99432.1 VWA domain-containing protein [Chondrinema litorale]